MVSAVFVYGTLKQGQCRAGLWPCRPQEVVAAWTLGRLFGRHDYPAMISGTERVLGECWLFVSDQMPTVLETLDQIEGTNQPGEKSLYDRVIIEVQPVTERPAGVLAARVLPEPGSDPIVAARQASVPAWTYHYASDPLEQDFHQLSPGRHGYVRWPS